MRCRAVGLGLVLGLSACAPTRYWQRAAGPIRLSAGFSLALPAGWMVLSTGSSTATGSIAASRDGPGLQCIAAGVTNPLGAPSPELSALLAWQRLPLYFSFGGEGKTALIVAGTLGGEAAPPEVIASTPVDLGGQPGFRAEVRWIDPTGLPVRAIILGATVGPHLYWILYAAPARHYFDLDLATFEEVASTFRIEPPPPPKPPSDPGPQG